MHPLECPKLYKSMWKFAFKLARNYPNRDAMAEDALQLGYLYAIKNWDNYDPSKGSLNKWLGYRIHAGFTGIRMKFRNHISLEDITSENPEHVIANSVLRKITVAPPRGDDIVYVKELMKLNKKVGQPLNQLMFTMRALGWTLEDIAAKCKCGEPNVRAQLKKQHKRINNAQVAMV